MNKRIKLNENTLRNIIRNTLMEMNKNKFNDFENGFNDAKHDRDLSVKQFDNDFNKNLNKSRYDKYRNSEASKKFDRMNESDELDEGIGKKIAKALGATALGAGLFAAMPSGRQDIGDWDEDVYNRYMGNDDEEENDSIPTDDSDESTARFTDFVGVTRESKGKKKITLNENILRQIIRNTLNQMI